MHEAIEFNPNPVENAMNAAFGFWEWLDANWSRNPHMNDTDIERTAVEAMSLHLPASMMDKATTGTLMEGTRCLTPHYGAEKIQIFNNVLLEVTVDPSLALEELPKDIFEPYNSQPFKQAVFNLAKLVAKDQLALLTPEC